MHSLISFVFTFIGCLSIINCSHKDRVPVKLHVPTGRFEFSELHFTITRINPKYDLLKDDLRQIIADGGLFQSEDVKMANPWFGDHYLNLDHDSDYLVQYSGISYPANDDHPMGADPTPIFRNKYNVINLYIRYDPVLKVEFAKDGNPNNLKFRWNSLPNVAYYSLYVTPIPKGDQRFEAILSCFVKNKTEITIREAFEAVSPVGRDFPNIREDTISYSTVKRIAPGIYEFSIGAWVYDPQLSRYTFITDNNKPQTKQEIKIDPY